MVRSFGGRRVKTAPTCRFFIGRKGLNSLRRFRRRNGCRPINRQREIKAVRPPSRQEFNAGKRKKKKNAFPLLSFPFFPFLPRSHFQSLFIFTFCFLIHMFFTVYTDLSTAHGPYSLNLKKLSTLSTGLYTFSQIPSRRPPQSLRSVYLSGIVAFLPARALFSRIFVYSHSQLNMGKTKPQPFAAVIFFYSRPRFGSA